MKTADDFMQRRQVLLAQVATALEVQGFGWSDECHKVERPWGAALEHNTCAVLLVARNEHGEALAELLASIESADHAKAVLELSKQVKP